MLPAVRTTGKSCEADCYGLWLTRGVVQNWAQPQGAAQIFAEPAVKQPVADSQFFKIRKERLTIALHKLCLIKSL